MRQLTRLIRYAGPYWWQILSSVLLMAAVGGLDAFKYLLVRPVFDRVLNPATGSQNIQLFVIPGAHHPVLYCAWSAIRSDKRAAESRSIRRSI